MKNNRHLLFRLASLFIVLSTSCSNNIRSVSSTQQDSFHVVSFDSNGGSPVEQQMVRHGEKIIKPKSPTKQGYSFDKWTYEGEEWSFAGFVVIYDMTLLANWIENDYVLTLINSDTSKGSISGSGTYAYGTSVTINAQSNRGYSFSGWFDETGKLFSSSSSYVFTINSDLVLTARWNQGNIYSVSLDTNGGFLDNEMVYAQFGQWYSLPTPNRPGYSFDGWYDKDGYGPFRSYGYWDYSCNKFLIAYWTIITYKINYILDGGTNDPRNPTTYQVIDNIVLYDPSKHGYSFNGWQIDNSIVKRINAGSTGDKDAVALWSANKNKLSILSSDPTKGTVDIVSGNGYSDEQITIKAHPLGDCVFVGWYENNKRISSESTLTFKMPCDDYSLTGLFLTANEKQEMDWNIAVGAIPTIDEETKTIKYGLYPQTNVDDEDLISALNLLDEVQANGWYLYNNNYYAKQTASTSYVGHEFDNGDIIVKNETYWFKCEPITWRILSEDNTSYFLLSDLILDCKQYSANEYITYIENGTDFVQANIYEFCFLRSWLNNEFYNSAFYLNNSFIQTVTNKNDQSTTVFANPNFKDMRDTIDDVFMPTFNDYKTEEYGFSSSTSEDISRCCKTTDWARAGNAFDSQKSGHLHDGYYYTRSPYRASNGVNSGVFCVNDTGAIFSSSYPTSESGIRPSICFKII